MPGIFGITGFAPVAMMMFFARRYSLPFSPTTSMVFSRRMVAFPLIKVMLFLSNSF